MLGVGWALLCVYFPDEQSACAVFRTYDYLAVGAVAHDFKKASRGLLGSLGFERKGRFDGTDSSTASTSTRITTDCSGRTGARADSRQG